MTIRILLNYMTLACIEFFTTGEMQGYITAVFYDMARGCTEHDITFRVYDPENGKNNVITHITDSFRLTDELIDSIEITLATLSEKCRLRDAVGLVNPNPDKIHYVEIHKENYRYWLVVNGAMYYDLDT